MGDSFVEQIVQCNPPKNAGLMKVLMVVACGVSAIFLFIPYVGFILTLAMIIFTVFMFRNYDYEYEYSFMSGELDVDKVIAKSTRKRMNTFDFNRMELVAPTDSQEAMRLERAQYKTFHYTSNTEGAKVYVAYVMNSDNEVVRVFFEPNEKLLEAIRYISPRKVII